VAHTIEHTQDTLDLTIDLSGIEIEDIEVFMQGGSRGIPDFAASSGKCCNCCSTSCGTAS
jgi:hypothetical protein